MSRNRSLALALMGISAVAFFAAAIAILVWPEETLKRYDTAWLRAILSITSGFVIILIAIELYNLWHDPPALRMTRHVMHYVMGIGATGTLGPISLFGLQKFEGFGISVTLQEVGVTSGLIFIATVAALILLNQHYTQCHERQQVNGQPPDSRSRTVA